QRPRHSDISADFKGKANHLGFLYRNSLIFSRKVRSAFQVRDSNVKPTACATKWSHARTCSYGPTRRQRKPLYNLRSAKLFMLWASKKLKRRGTPKKFTKRNQSCNLLSEFGGGKQKRQTSIITCLPLVENTGIDPVTSCMPCKRSTK